MVSSAVSIVAVRVASVLASLFALSSARLISAFCCVEPADERVELGRACS